MQSDIWDWNPNGTGPICVEFACSPRTCMGFLRVLRFPPTSKHAPLRLSRFVFIAIHSLYQTGSQENKVKLYACLHVRIITYTSRHPWHTCLCVHTPMHIYPHLLMYMYIHSPAYPKYMMTPTHRYIHRHIQSHMHLTMAQGPTHCSLQMD